MYLEKIILFQFVFFNKSKQKLTIWLRLCIIGKLVVDWRFKLLQPIAIKYKLQIGSNIDYLYIQTTFVHLNQDLDTTLGFCYEMQLDLQLDIVSSGYIAMQQSNGLSCNGEQRMTDNSSLITIQEDMKDVDEQVRNHEDMMEDHFESMEAQARNPSTMDGQFASSSSLARWLEQRLV